MARLSRRAYAEMYGPTVGDRLRLADTDLVIEVEADHTVYGEEVKFGGGKVIRDGMGQSQRMSADVVDTVITNGSILLPPGSVTPEEIAQVNSQVEKGQEQKLKDLGNGK